jgi:ubiquinone/menaquinone biosynthesis C-methylase UbiE
MCGTARWMMANDTRLYEIIGGGYDTTRRADSGIVDILLRLLDVGGGGTYVDLACGTGNYTVALAKSGGHWIGVDNSARMIATAQRKSTAITWHVANATSLPLPSHAVSGVVCVLAIHHFPALFDTFREVRRILRAGGRLVLFTASREQMRGYWLNAYFPRAMAKAIEQMPDTPEVERILRLADIAPTCSELFVVGPQIQDFFLYSGKYFPDRYLDPQIRAGISTFVTLADPTEIVSGCEQLAADIRSGRWCPTHADARPSEGDYLFLVGEAG